MGGSHAWRAGVTRDEFPPRAQSQPAGEVLMVLFELDGRRFQALNGGPEFTFDEAVSFSVACEDQAEIDRYWERLLEGGGEQSRCGWLRERVMRALFGMRRIVPAKLEEAARGAS